MDWREPPPETKDFLEEYDGFQNFFFRRPIHWGEYFHDNQRPTAKNSPNQLPIKCVRIFSTV